MSSTATVFASSMHDRLRRALLDACAAVGAANACLHTRSRDHQRILCQAVTASFRPTRLAHGLDLSDCPAVLEVLATGRAIAIEDATADERVASVARARYGLRSVLYQPVGGAAVVIFSHQQPHAWQGAELAAAAAAAERLAQLLAERGGSPDERYGDTEARLRAMLDTSAGIVAAIDDRLVVYEASVPRGFELGVAELLQEVRSGQRGAEVERALAELFAREREEYEAVLMLESGPTELRLRVHPEGAGRVEGVLVAARSLADTDAAVSLLRREERTIALGRISARVAHEFNNILQIIANAAEVLRERCPAEPLDGIEQAVERGARLAKQLLLFAKPTPATRIPVRLDKVLDDMRSLLENAVGQEHVILFGGRSSGTVEVDVEQLRLVLVNLCLNARDACPPGSRVDVTVMDGVMSGGRPCASLEVTDRGGGMTDEVRARAFEPFFSTKADGRGTGLGLPTVRAFTDTHDGEVHVDTAVGKGTRIRLDLPHIAAHPSPAAPRPSGRLRGTRLLVVEDEPATGVWVQRVLAAEGAEVALHRSIAGALGELEAGLPDGIVLDMTLPDGHGTSILEAVAGRVAPSRIVIASGYAGVERPSLVELGHAWLEKPYGREGLVAAVVRAVGRELPPEP